MSNAKLNEIRIKNFKIIDDSEEKIINLREYNLTVLDGPNGFGKTTIFDSIEILITGKVSRIVKTEYRPNDKPIVFANNSDSPIVLKAEFQLEDGAVLRIMRKIDNPKTGGKIEHLEKAFKLYEIEEMTDILGNEIEQNYLNKKIGLFPNEQSFLMMNYIPQEDTLSFLKNNEKDRMDKINKLFNLDEVNSKYKELRVKRLYINGLHEDIKGNTTKKGRIKELREQLENLKASDEEVSQPNRSYNQLINWNIQYWDQEDIEVTIENYEIINQTLKDIKQFRIKFTDYFTNKNNEYIKELYKPDKEIMIKNLIKFGMQFEDFDDMKVKNNLLIKLKSELELVTKNKFIELFKLKKQKFDDWSFMDEKEIDSMITELSTCESIEREMNTDESVLKELIDLRTLVLEKHVEYIEEHADESDKCPYCGKSYENESIKLTEAFDERTKIFEKRNTDNGIVINGLLSKLKDKFKSRIIDGLNKKIEELKFDELLFKELKENELNFEKYSNANSAIKKVLPNFENHHNKEGLLNEEVILKRYSAVVQELKSKLKDIGGEYLSMPERVRFGSVYSDIFNSDKENIVKVGIEAIDKKINYIQFKYFSSINLKRNIILNKIDDLKESEKMLSVVKSEIQKVEKVYKDNIDSYFSDMIKTLEIPFYLYSGKIIQDYREGLGVYIKSEEGEDLKKIKFVSHNSSSHDLLNKFSSGQLTGVILSLLLSMNSMFSGSGLNMLLIDDPVQTMDEINIFGLVDVLRNEFSKKQLIMSTHENDISRYFRYKFNKTGVRTLNIDVKETLNKRIFTEIV